MNTIKKIAIKTVHACTNEDNGHINSSYFVLAVGATGSVFALAILLWIWG